MPRTAIVDNATGAILVLDPTTDEDGAPILPEGYDCRVVELSDTQAAKLSTPNARFTVSGKTVVVEPVPEATQAPTDLDGLRQAIENANDFETFKAAHLAYLDATSGR